MGFPLSMFPKVWASCVLAERKYVFVEGVAPLCRFVAICETWQSCALKSWHFLRFYQSFLIRRWRFILVFRLKEREHRRYWWFVGIKCRSMRLIKGSLDNFSGRRKGCWPFLISFALVKTQIFWEISVITPFIWRAFSSCNRRLKRFIYCWGVGLWRYVLCHQWWPQGANVVDSSAYV